MPRALKILLKWACFRGMPALFLAFFALSCGGGAGGGSSPAGSLRVFNDGSLALTQLYVTRSSSPTWGPNQLGAVPMYPGDSITLTPLAPDSYDVRGVYSDGSTDLVYDVQVTDQSTTVLSLMNSGNGAVSVLNNASLPITGIYLTLSSSSTWGPNQIDSPLYPGQTLTFTGVSPGTYDLRAYFSNGGYSDFRGFSVVAYQTTPITIN